MDPDEAFTSGHTARAPRGRRVKIASWYDDNSDQVVAAYEAIDPAELFAWVADLLPSAPSAVLDVGAGTGRDAAWFAASGHEVVAIEPSASMRAHAIRLHGSPRIEWLADGLPSLERTTRIGFGADVILAGAVWQHVVTEERPRAFRKLTALLRSGGLLIVTLRHGSDDGRGSYGTNPDELEALARNNGLQVVRRVAAADASGRPDVTWTNYAMRLPDDGTGALPLLRRLIQLDQKSSTYKLGLLRALCRAADGSAGMAVEAGEEHVSLPLGLVALNWMRLYLPLTGADLPQSPTNRCNEQKLGFAGPGWKAVAAGAVVPADLRVGATFGGAAARAVRTAVAEVSETIRDMPTRHLTYTDGRRIFETVPGKRIRDMASPLTLDEGTLGTFGRISVPRHVWTALQRWAAWIEPAIVAEWMRQTTDYAASQEREIDVARMAAAMVWNDAERETAVSRSIALRGLADGCAVRCVWSGKMLTPDTLNIDHCLPWSVWPCGDLWNLVPADRFVNQHYKRDRLPSAEALATSEEAIVAWWRSAYLRGASIPLSTRFGMEARASLPGLAGRRDAFETDDVYNALRLQRLRLRQDQGTREWTWRG